MAWGDRHSRLDRWLHELAFHSWPLQTALADVEDLLFRARLAQLTPSRPVFIAGLPRAGTTLLLELIEGAGEFASLHYRDMPFLLTPLIWSEATRSLKRSSQPEERAHGDGVLIDVNSPEAFEEVVWRTHFGRRYRKAHIEPWPAETDEDFATFFRRYMTKVVAVRRSERPDAQRYLSKNNGNIARLPAIRALAPDAIILVPFREPLAHAASLLKQHRRFLDMHHEDSFAQRYMAAIGHYDFGAHLKPINFGGWLDGVAEPDFTTLEAWLRYWIAAYRHLADQADALGLQFISFEGLCAAPAHTLETLEATLGVARPRALSRNAGRVWPPPAPPPVEGVDPQLLEQAGRVRQDLERRLPVTAPEASESVS